MVLQSGEKSMKSGKATLEQQMRSVAESASPKLVCHSCDLCDLSRSSLIAKKLKALSGGNKYETFGERSVEKWDEHRSTVANFPQTLYWWSCWSKYRESADIFIYNVKLKNRPQYFYKYTYSIQIGLFGFMLKRGRKM
jgi:hypothetical protein